METNSLTFEIAFVLPEARRKAGLPVQDLAKMFGVKRRQFYHFLAGEDEPTHAQAAHILRVAAAIDQIGNLVNNNSHKARAAILARIDGDDLYRAAVSAEKDRLNLALEKALAAIHAGAIIQRRLAPSNRARPTKSEAQAMREFLRATRDETGPEK